MLKWTLLFKCDVVNLGQQSVVGFS